MQLTSKFNNVFRFLLCVIDIYSKYAWVIPLKDKKGITIKSNQIAHQMKYEQIKTMNFTIDHLNYG